MGLFDFFKKKEEPAPRTLKTEEFLAVGVNYYEYNIKKLAVSNKDWKSRCSTIVKEGKAGTKIFRYDFINKPVKLVPEPKNKHDKNAVQIIIAGELVGYISQDKNVHVKNILTQHEVKFVSSFISGGEYKVVSENGDMRKDEHSLKVTVKIGYV